MADKVCAYKECGVEFQAKTHNQRYHDPECCRRATNSRIMEDYYAKKERRRGTARLCSGGCSTVLSRYNDSDMCGKCEARDRDDERQDLLRMLSGLSRS